MEPQNPQTPQSPQAPQQPAQPQVPPQAMPATPETPVTPTTQNPFSRGNSFSRRRGASAAGVATPQAPIVSSGDDIVLPPAPAAKPKRNIWPIIAGVVIAILIVIVIILIFTVGKRQSQDKGLANALNNYGSMLMFGDTSHTNAAAEYDSTGVYYIRKKLDSDESIEEKQKYFSTLHGYYDSIMQAADALKNQDTVSAALEHIDASYNAILFLELVYTNVLPSDEDIVTAYLADGATATREYVANMYAIFEDNAYRYADSYITLKTQYAYSIVELLDTYTALGCINNGEIAVECVNGTIITNDSVADLAESDAEHILQLAVRDSLDFYHLAYQALNSEGTQ